MKDITMLALYLSICYVGVVATLSTFPGVRFHNKKPVLLTGERWRVVEELNVTKLHLEALDMERAVSQLEETYRAAVRDVHDLECFRNEINRVQQIAGEVTNATQTLFNMLPRGRSKRGLIDVGGKLVKIVFGNPDAEDLERLDKHLATLERKEEEIVHVVREQLTLTKKFGRRVETNTLNIFKMANLLNVKMAETEMIIKGFVDTLKEIKYLLTFSMSFTSELRNMELDVLKAKSDVRDLYEGLASIMGERVSPVLFSPSELQGILMNVTTLLPHDLRLIAGVGTEDVHLHYQSATVHGIAFGELLQIIVDFPLEADNHRFQIYEVSVLPVDSADLKKVVALPSQADYFLVSDDQQYYALLTDRYVRRCRQANLWICPVDFPVYHRHQATCVSAIYFGEKENARKLCDWRVLKSVHDPVWIWDNSNNSWWYSLSEPAALTIQCKGQADQEIRLEKQGNIVAPEGCTMRTEFSWFPPTWRGVSKMTLDKRIEFVKPVTVWRAPLKVPMKTELVDEALKLMEEEGRVDWSSWAADQVRLKDLEQILDRMEEEGRYNKVLVWSTGSGGILILVLVTVAIILWFTRRYWCRKNPYRQPHFN